MRKRVWKKYCVDEGLEVGGTVEVTLIRDGEEMTADVTLGERPEQP
jgi:S1-C subfamily serine protease